jgi:hypothetical protein
MMPRYRFPSSIVSMLRTGCSTRPSEKAASASSIVEISWSPVQQIADAFLTQVKHHATPAGERLLPDTERLAAA